MRFTVRSFVALAGMLTAAACSEPTAAPRTSAPTVADRVPSFDVSSFARTMSQSSDFTVTSNGGSFGVAGLFTVNFPAGSVCDPDRSSYGPGEWDKACVLLAGGQSIAVHATVSVTGAGLAVDFQPTLRFSPDAQVTVSTDVFAPILTANREYFSRNPSALRPLAMYYAPALGAATVADYLSDPSAVTHINLQTGRVWRRVKHFSGYSITSGEACDPSPGDPDCVSTDRI